MPFHTLDQLEARGKRVLLRALARKLSHPTSSANFVILGQTRVGAKFILSPA